MSNISACLVALQALIVVIETAPQGLTFEEAVALINYIAYKEWGNG